MKKNGMKDQKQNRKPRRLSLNRETIQVLQDPALLEQAMGGLVHVDSRPPLGGACCGTGSSG